MKGFLITFEGGEGCGKTTQIKLLEKYLKSVGKVVVGTREPGGTKLGKEIRKILLGSALALSQIAELLLFEADRAQHVAEIIQPALEEGKIVLCDRFIDSTLAYQIGGRNLPEELVRYLNNLAAAGLIPDLTFLLDLPPAIGLARALAAKGSLGGRAKGVDRFENEAVTFHQKLQHKYKEIAAHSPDRIKIINSEQPIETVQAQIKNMVKEKLTL